ncbi:MAG: glycerophosphodiester phosphodiesterase [Alphaproteobacteria bacterium]|nr:glycerophosphodiester phosphodiesterase [Alphaproteobacteria bacterium]MBV9370324.1 glycerophosphodiester phosphodiesterase [Alphaproteobacteria bacterium]MBV9902019.1 glycerophosphodiester phosphodiesterase [Alphaproteobacteria bacterium]
MKVFAHRGFHRRSRHENTLEAFQKAVDAGVDGIETDVRADGEGQAFLFHNRCLDDGTPVSSLTLAEIERRLGYRPPTLAETLGQGWRLDWDIELKNEAALAAALPVLREAARREALFVTSFVHRVVREAAAALDLPGGFLIAHSPADASALPARLPGIPYLVWDFESITDQSVADAASAGYRNMVYGPVTREEHERAAGLAFEAVITDFPEYLL